MKNLLFLAFLLIESNLFGQDAILKTTSFRADNNSVQIELVIAGGNTCNGISVFHSTQPTLGFTLIGKIDGICGSSEVDSRYNFTHEYPTEFDSNYYYFEFGGIGASKVKSFFYVPFGLNDIAFSFVNHSLNIFVKSEKHEIEMVYIMDIQGNVLQKTKFITNSVTIDLCGLSNQIILVFIQFKNGTTIAKKILRL